MKKTLIYLGLIFSLVLIIAAEKIERTGEVIVNNGDTLILRYNSGVWTISSDTTLVIKSDTLYIGNDVFIGSDIATNDTLSSYWTGTRTSDSIDAKIQLYSDTSSTVTTTGTPVSTYLTYFSGSNTITSDSELRRSDFVNNDNLGFGGVYGSVTSAEGNVAFGASSVMPGLESGNYNIGIGSSSFASLVDGTGNIGIGLQSLASISDGSYNTGIGYAVFSNNVSGNNNSAFGRLAGNLNTGTDNIFIGAYSGSYLTSYSNIIIINSLDRSTIAGDTTNSIIYGLQASLSSNQQLYFNSNVTIKHNLDINNKINLAHYINSTPQEGDVWYDTLTRAINIKNDIDNTTLQVGEEFRHRVYNNSGSTIVNGRAVRRTGSHIDGYRIPTIALAGNSTYDSALVYGVTTHDIPNMSYGYITKFGDASDLDLSGLNQTIAYLGFAGNIIDTMPDPPNWTTVLGEIIYADNDSGILDVGIIAPMLSKSPTLSANFYDSTITINIVTQNVYYPITNAGNNAFNVVDRAGVIFQGDSAQVQFAGQWNINLGGSFAGESVSDTWKFGIHVNGELKYSSERYTNSTNTGAVPANVGLTLNDGDWVSFRIVNTTSTRNPTFKNASISMIQLHL